MEMLTNNETIFYQPTTSLKLKVILNNETVRLQQQSIADLFGVERSVITKHLRNIFKTQELQEHSVCAKIAHTAKDGKIYKTNFYNLDAILSVGYRVNSHNATTFRKRATSVLKDYMFKGIAIHKRIENLEQHSLSTDTRLSKAEQQLNFFIEKALPKQSGIFFDGEVFDAHTFLINLIKTAKKRLILIDNYLDETVLTMFAQREKGVTATLYTEKIETPFQLALTKHNTQYPQVKVKTIQNFHDRFLIIDEQIYHIGASIKDLGKKVFAFSKLELGANVIIERLPKETSN